MGGVREGSARERRSQRGCHVSLFEYVMIPPAIVLGLAITHLLTGFGRVVHFQVWYALVGFAWTFLFFWLNRPALSAG